MSTNCSNTVRSVPLPMAMKYDKKTIQKLVKELVDLWGECKVRSERIEELARQLDVKNKER